MAKRKLRRCNDCKVCCEALPIGGSLEGVMCESINVMGCEEYPDRPPECRDFDCLWVLDRHLAVPLMTEKERPDLLGVLFMDNAEPLEITPGALKTSKARTAIKRLSKRMKVRS